MRLAIFAAAALLALPACSTEPIQADPPRTQSGGPDFATTGELPCSANTPLLDRTCIFGISIAGRTAALQVVNPTSDVEGIQRVLLFRHGSWATLAGEAAEARPIDGGTLIVVDGREFYALPDRVFRGR